MIVAVKDEKLLKRFWKKVDKKGPNDCWEWTAAKLQDGYGKIRISEKMIRSHRFSYELHKGKIPEGLYVLHSCHNPSCVNPNHLRLGTHQDNMDDKINAGRDVNLKGEKHGKSLLAETEANAVIEMLKRFPPTRKRNKLSFGINSFLGRWFGVSHATISCIGTGRSWQHLEN